MKNFKLFYFHFLFVFPKRRWVFAQYMVSEFQFHSTNYSFVIMIPKNLEQHFFWIRQPRRVDHNFNFKVIFDNNFSNVNIVNSVIYKFLCILELILLTKNFSCFLGWFIMIYTCVVKACTSCSRKLKKWEEAVCTIHNFPILSEFCDCTKPFM